MRAKRKDANHHEIVEEFESLGLFCEDMTARDNFCDLLVINPVTHYCAFIEIKDGNKPPSKRKLTKGESAFRQRCLDAHVNWYKVENIEDCKGVKLALSYCNGI